MKILGCWGAECLIGKSVGGELVQGRDELTNKVKGRGEGTTAMGENGPKLGLCNQCGGRGE